MSVLRTVTRNGVVVGQIECTGDVEKNFALAEALLKSKGLEWKPPPPADTIFRGGQLFAAVAADIFYKNAPADPSLGDESIPFAVNAAFAAELFLKTLYMLDGVKKRGHTILGLFNSLSAARREAIVSSARLVAAQFSQAVDDEESFRKIMASLNSTFVDWRYLHETHRTGVISTGGTMLATVALETACRVGGANTPEPYHVDVQ